MLKLRMPMQTSTYMAVFFAHTSSHTHTRTRAYAGVAKAKKLYLKDVLARQALEHGPELPSSDDDDGERQRGGGAGTAGPRAPKAYDAEQEDLRRAFLSAAADGDDGGADDGAEELLGGMVRRRQVPAADNDDGEAGGGGGSGKLGRRWAERPGKRRLACRSVSTRVHMHASCSRPAKHAMREHLPTRALFVQRPCRACAVSILLRTQCVKCLPTHRFSQRPCQSRAM